MFLRPLPTRATVFFCVFCFVAFFFAPAWRVVVCRQAVIPVHSQREHPSLSLALVLFPNTALVGSRTVPYIVTVSISRRTSTLSVSVTGSLPVFFPAFLTSSVFRAVRCFSTHQIVTRCRRVALPPKRDASLPVRSGVVQQGAGRCRPRVHTPRGVSALCRPACVLGADPSLRERRRECLCHGSSPVREGPSAR